VVKNAADVSSIGAIESRYYTIGQWYSSPFQYINGSLVTSGYGLSDTEGYAAFDITGMIHSEIIIRFQMGCRGLQKKTNLDWSSVCLLQLKLSGSHPLCNATSASTKVGLKVLVLTV
jgi:hypothetical protein